MKDYIEFELTKEQLRKIKPAFDEKNKYNESHSPDEYGAILFFQPYEDYPARGMFIPQPYQARIMAIIKEYRIYRSKKIRKSK